MKFCYSVVFNCSVEIPYLVLPFNHDFSVNCFTVCVNFESDTLIHSNSGPNFIFLNSSKDIELACEPGFYSQAGSARCTACPPGYKCPNKDGSGNQPCLDGEYSIGGQTSCTACPKGYACPNTTTDYMIKCEPGFYATRKKTVCTPCKAGL